MTENVSPLLESTRLWASTSKLLLEFGWNTRLTTFSRKPIMDKTVSGMQNLQSGSCKGRTPLVGLTGIIQESRVQYNARVIRRSGKSGTNGSTDYELQATAKEAQKVKIRFL